MSDSTRPRKRRRLQFGLSSLLVVVTLSSVVIFLLARPSPSVQGQLSDEQLRAAIEKTKLGDESEPLLLEVVRRGGQSWNDYLTNRHDALMRFVGQPLTKDDDLNRLTLSNLHLLTALRRVQKKPDPLRILIAGKLNRYYSLDERPSFRLSIVNLDEEEQAVLGFTCGGNDRTGRLARWRSWRLLAAALSSNTMAESRSIPQKHWTIGLAPSCRRRWRLRPNMLF